MRNRLTGVRIAEDVVGALEPHGRKRLDRDPLRFGLRYGTDLRALNHGSDRGNRDLGQSPHLLAFLIE